jgi:hypothetical protein
MVQSVGTAGTVGGVASITALRYAQPDGASIVVPVRPVQSVLASFRHIEVRPDARLQEGVPLYKLKILDSLIDALTPASGRGPAAARGLDEAGVDRLVADLSAQARAAADAGAGAGGAGARGAAGGPYRAAFLPLPGAFVDLLA